MHYSIVNEGMMYLLYSESPLLLESQKVHTVLAETECGTIKKLMRLLSLHQDKKGGGSKKILLQEQIRVDSIRVLHSMQGDELSILLMP